MFLVKYPQRTQGILITDEMITDFRKFLEKQGVVIGDNTSEKCGLFLKLVNRLLRFTEKKVLDAPEIILEGEKELIQEAIKEAGEQGLLEEFEKKIELGVIFVIRKRLKKIKKSFEEDFERFRNFQNLSEDDIREFSRGDFYIEVECNAVRDIVLNFNKVSPFGKLSNSVINQLLNEIDDLCQSLLKEWTSLLKQTPLSH